MNDLTNAIWIEKYRPTNIEDLILDKKAVIYGYLENPKAMPSLIFYSSKPGTGKTSTAKIISQMLECDTLTLNSSLDRGIDSIRDRVNSFARAASSNPEVKRCVFFDEADGLTKQAQESLRNLMEEYSDNCFFIFTANDLAKIIEPIRSRCQSICFENPNKAAIEMYLSDICEKESVVVPDDELPQIIEACYPDVRRMVNQLQLRKMNVEHTPAIQSYELFLDFLRNKNVKEVYDTVYSGEFDILGFNKWYFRKLYESYDSKHFDRTKQIALRLADTERSHNVGANLEVIFIANMMEVMNLL